MNGLDAGAEAADTWYYIYVIYDSTDGSIAGLLSVSDTAPTLPGTYDKKRLVGVVRNDSSSDFIAFLQRDELVVIEPQTLVTGFGFTTWQVLSLVGLVPISMAHTVQLLNQCRDNATRAAIAVALMGVSHASFDDTVQDSIGVRYHESYVSAIGVGTTHSESYESCEMVMRPDGDIYVVAHTGDYSEVFVTGYRLML